MVKPIKFKNNALIAMVIFLVIVVGGSIFITKYNSKPERLILGKWNVVDNISNIGEDTVEFTKEGKLITSTEKKNPPTTYKLDSSDKKNIQLNIKTDSHDSKFNLKFISIYKFELSSPELGNKVTFERLKQ